MEITLNDTTHTTSENCTLYQIVFSQIGDKQKGIAVAVNNSVISKSDWENYIVKPNDNILIIKATQGG